MLGCVVCDPLNSLFSHWIRIIKTLHKHNPNQSLHSSNRPRGPVRLSHIPSLAGRQSAVESFKLRQKERQRGAEEQRGVDAYTAPPEGAGGSGHLSFTVLTHGCCWYASARHGRRHDKHHSGRTGPYRHWRSRRRPGFAWPTLSVQLSEFTEPSSATRATEPTESHQHEHHQT